MLNDKIIIITGGTGTIGTALIDYILVNFEPKVIRIFSRDESKQNFLRNKFKNHEENLRFFIGDIRDKERLNRAMKNVDIVFHLAALKHVVACEYNPFEAIKTNVLGIQNIIELSIDNNVKRVIYTSTDKAAAPCNTMGVTKLLGEKLITAADYYKGKDIPIFHALRFGNVLGSRGSIIPIIEENIKNNLPINLTHRDMTRYVLDINTAIKFIIDTMKIAQGGEIFIMKMKVVKIVDLIEVLIEYFAKKYNKEARKINIKEIGMFAGEKLYEELFSIEESERTYENDNIFIILPQIKEIFSKIDLSQFSNLKKFDQSQPFNTKNGPFLSKQEIKKYLININII
jgi:FlaA1/EpsC-like NDP-sugar epimerase